MTIDLHTLPPVIREFVDAANRPDPAAFWECFAEEALVLDEGQERRGREAIRQWSLDHHFGAHIQLEAVQYWKSAEEIGVAFEVDGDFDKTGLPNPLVLDFLFRIGAGKIQRLVIRSSRRIVNHVLLKLIDHSPEQVEQARNKLLILKGKIDELMDIRVEANVRPGASAYDLILITAFASMEDLERYLVHPAHQEVAQWIGTVVETQASVCCEV